VHLKKFPKGHQLKLFRLAMSTHRTDYVVTNDLSQDSADAARGQSAIRWKKVIRNNCLERCSAYIANIINIETAHFFLMN